jgi:hypothetical protein
MVLARDLAERQLKLTNDRFLLTGKQTDLAEKQHGLLRLQFYAEHRPRLVLKEVYFARADDFSTLVYELANTGGSKAKITGGFVAIDLVSNFRQFKAMAGYSLGRAFSAEINDGWVEPFTIGVPSPVQYRVTHPSGIFGAPALDSPSAMPEGIPESGVYFFGMLSYADGRGEEFGTVRGAVFRRKWDAQSGSFQRTEGPDHEYAD